MQETSISAAAEAPARLRGGTFTMMVLDVAAEGDPLAGVSAKLKQAPSFFDGAPVVLDLLAAAKNPRLDLVDLIGELRELGLVPVGVQNGSEQQNSVALALGLCPFPLWRSGRQRPERATESRGDESLDSESRGAEPREGEAAQARAGASGAERGGARPPARSANTNEAGQSAGAEGPTALLVTHPVRSGKRLYARGGDLVAAAPISAGAELIADGHIHVYGPLRGRALAGVRGDESARIFCQSLEAELVSIAGAYRVREDIDEALIGKPVQIFLKDGQLVIDPLVRTLK